ncbi:MAG: M28 family peptidase [Gammaproteobacteria bacterium]|nr:M28 family peptidase [Gammaproteobacteria bacterium]
MRMFTRLIAATVFACGLTSVAAAAAGVGPDIAALSRIPAVAGYEQALAGAIQRSLAAEGLHPDTDNLDDVWATVGSGSPHRLIVASLDRPGYVVSQIAAQGYLRVQRLPQSEPNAVFDALSFAQPALVVATDAELNAGFAGLSTHLAPGRLNPPGMTHIDELYLDIGARSAAEARAAGVDVLDPVSLAQPPITVGADDEAGPGAGDRFGWEALLEVARGLDRAQASGTTTIAFVTQQWLGGRGLTRLLTELPADEMIFVGRLQTPAGATAAGAAAPQPGDGVLIGGADGTPASTSDLAAALQSLASARHIPCRAVAAAPPRMAGFGGAPALPQRFAQLGVSTLLPVTPAETFARADLRGLARLLEAYLEEPMVRMSAGDDPFDAARGSDFPERLAASERVTASASPTVTTLKALTLAYGASGHEEGVRRAVLAQLPDWARQRTRTDAAGNLVLSMGSSERGRHGPDLVFDAHLDEIGYQVTQIESDGRLQVKNIGGFYGRYYLGHVTLVHTSGGHAVGGVMELPQGWDRPDFEWPPHSRVRPSYVYVGTRSEAETEKLGIRVGDYLTIPKAYRPLLGSMVAVRSNDDRVGDTALVETVRALGPDFARKWPGRHLTFVWTTGEEVGLDGAVAYAASVAKHAPDVVFAIDTFVSSDSPMETQRFADAVLGQGFVVRAVDNSNIDPPADVARVIRMAHDHDIPVQWGATSGGNDGAAYTRYGTVDVAMGWPMVYSHSPVETVSTKDIEALSRITELLATKW